jgi:hypothetical protein
MGFARFISCLFGRHRRDRRRVRHDGNDFRSFCSGCGAPMIRDDQRGWIVDREPE